MKGEEIWKDIAGYEGIYKISNKGKVLSVSRELLCIEKNRQFAKTIGGKILKQTEDCGGYMVLYLHRDKKRDYRFVHRLVAEAFIPNPNGYKYVNHIDENKKNNNVENLEWCTFEYNVRYSQSRIVARISQTGKIEKVYNSICEVEEDGYSCPTVTNILNGKEYHHTHKGKRWVEIPREGFL